MYRPGVRTLAQQDPARTYFGEPRPLLTEVWYPTVETADTNRFADYFPGGITPDIDALMQRSWLQYNASWIDAHFHPGGYRDAPIAPGRFPLALFSHGNDSYRFQSTFFCHALAAAGYIVAAPDHPGSAMLTLANGRLLPFREDLIEASYTQRPLDLIAVLDQLLSMLPIDPDRIVATGMSRGGHSAMQALELDPRIRAAVAMAGSIPHVTRPAPRLWMLAGEDGILRGPRNQAILQQFATAPTPCGMLWIPEAGHTTFMDVLQFSSGTHHDGTGPATRSNGEPFVYVDWRAAYARINQAALWFLGQVLQQDPSPPLMSDAVARFEWRDR